MLGRIFGKKKPAVSASSYTGPARTPGGAPMGFQVFPAEVWEDDKIGAFLREAGFAPHDPRNIVKPPFQEILTEDRTRLVEITAAVNRATPHELQPQHLLSPSIWNGRFGAWLLENLDLSPYRPWNTVFLPTSEAGARAYGLPTITTQTVSRLAEDALAKLLPRLDRPAKPSWTAHEALPGGDLPNADFEGFVTQLALRYPGIDRQILHRLARRHGSLARDVLGDAKSLADMGEHIGHGLTAREITYMKDREWAVAPDDILWRRTKTGVHFAASKSDAEQRAIAGRIGAYL